LLDLLSVAQPGDLYLLDNRGDGSFHEGFVSGGAGVPRSPISIRTVFSIS
jgi:hypothetical protein